MQPASTLTVFDVLTDFLASEPNAQAILQYRLPPELEERALQLLQLKREDRLTADEEVELSDFIRADDLMALLKAKTRLKRTGNA